MVKELLSSTLVKVVTESDWEDAIEDSSGGMISKDKSSKNVPKDLMSKFDSMAGTRFQGHIKRLLTPERTKVERNFGISLLKNYDKIHDLLRTVGIEDSEKISNILSLIGGEGNTTTTWWTLAPYIFAKLLDRLDDENTAMGHTLKYASVSEDFDISDYEIGLKGLEYHNNGWKTRTFVLSSNQESPSHKVAKKLADSLVDLGYVI